MAEQKSCFIIMPITTPEPMRESYRDGQYHFRHVLQCLFEPGVEKAGYKPIPPTAKGSDLIHAQIVKNLETADLVLCDMSCLNPNVFFEFGIRTSLNKPVCVVKDELTEKVPFDTVMLNYQEYKSTLEPWELDAEIAKLAEHVKTSADRSKGENTLWRHFGIRTAAAPYQGETGADAKLDYLTMQMDALKQKLDASEQPSYSRIEQEAEQAILTEHVLKVVRKNFPEAEFCEAHKRENVVSLVYKRPIPYPTKDWIRNYVFRSYGLGVSLKMEPPTIENQDEEK